MSTDPQMARLELLKTVHDYNANSKIVCDLITKTARNPIQKFAAKMAVKTINDQSKFIGRLIEQQFESRDAIEQIIENIPQD